MIKKKTVTAIILVAGNSTRYGKNKNKNFETINRKPILFYSLKAFDINKYIDNIIIATRESELNKVKKMVSKQGLTKRIDVIVGGSSRKGSVYNCITHTEADIVIIHDGARPLIQQEFINNCIESMKSFKGVTIAVKSKDTIKITDDNDIVIDTTKRSNTWLIQTPQCFDRKLLLDMHNKYKDDEVTDDCSLLEKDGYSVKMIPGDYSNIKITTEDDLMIIRDLFKTLNKKNEN